MPIQGDLVRVGVGVWGCACPLTWVVVRLWLCFALLALLCLPALSACFLVFFAGCMSSCLGRCKRRQDRRHQRHLGHAAAAGRQLNQLPAPPAVCRGLLFSSALFPKSLDSKLSGTTKKIDSFDFFWPIHSGSEECVCVYYMCV